MTTAEEPRRRPAKRGGLELVPLWALLLFGLLMAARREVDRAAQLGSGPERAGDRVERCLRCHQVERESPGGAHAAAALGCSACHLGNPLAYEADRAHAGMEPEPGALATVERTCGRADCHAREAERVAGSLMTTGRGLIAVDRWAFGELEHPDGDETFAELLGVERPTPAQDHLRKLCAGCHLGGRAANRDDAIRSAGAGCAACHLRPRAATGPAAAGEAPAHPAVDATVGDDRCLGCHSRSGRISLSYQGLAELHRAGDPCDDPLTLHDGRPGCRLEADVHQRAGMTCVDCHLHTELMGDGEHYLHKEEAVEIRCESCHGPVLDIDRGGLERTWGAVDDPISRDLLRLAGKVVTPSTRVRTGARGTPLWHVEQAKSGWELSRKSDDKRLSMAPTPSDTNHDLAGHERLSCSSCHATWTPRCTTCHTRFEADGEQWDFAAAGLTRGAWREEADNYGWGPPTLALAGDRIVPATPGMIMTLAAPELPAAKRQQRLFAQLSPHTTTERARSCSSCHASATALGLGEGQLQLTGEAIRFTPAAPDPQDPGRGVDGWVTLGAPTPAPGTRRDLRSLDRDEQVRVLRVGVCLACHDTGDDPLYVDFAASVARWLVDRGACEQEPSGWLRAEPPEGAVSR